MTTSCREEFHIAGLTLVPGLSLGIARRVSVLNLDVLAAFRQEIEDVETEIARFRAALARSREQIEGLCGDEQTDIKEVVGAQLVMLDDETLAPAIVKRITDTRLNSECIVAEAAAEWRARFESLQDPALRARAMDIQDVYHRILRDLLDIEHVRCNPLAELPDRTVLVSDYLLPSDILHLDAKRLVGFVTERGSAVSHTAILAQSLRIPFVSEATEATALIRTDDRVLLDADAGCVVVHPSPDTIARSHRKRVKTPRKAPPLALPDCITRDGIRIRLLANATCPEDVKLAVSTGADGIGLFRTEFFYLRHASIPDTAAEVRFYRSVFTAARNLRVTFRLFDFGGDKIPAFIPDAEVSSTALGCRGIRYLLKNPELLRRQVRCLAKAAGGRAFDILLPFVTTRFEVERARALILEELGDNSREAEACRIGTMLEVPSAFVAMESVMREADFISVGTNDLAQLLFACDREDHVDAVLASEMQDVMFAILESAVDRAAAMNRPLCVCGEMAADHKAVPLLLKAGVRALSVAPAVLPNVHSEISRTSSAIDEQPRPTHAARTHDIASHAYR